MGFIYITSFGGVEERLLIASARNIKETFGVEARLSSMPSPPPAGFDNLRNQYHAGSLLRYLRSFSFPHMIRGVGILDIDLYEERREFVFGSAEVGGKVAIVSTYRLRHPNERITFERVLKELNHELGITFGLKHCQNKRCVMSPSSSLKEMDFKGKHFCEECSDALEQRLSSYR